MSTEIVCLLFCLQTYYNKYVMIKQMFFLSAILFMVLEYGIDVTVSYEVLFNRIQWVSEMHLFYLNVWVSLLIHQFCLSFNDPHVQQHVDTCVFESCTAIPSVYSVPWCNGFCLYTFALVSSSVRITWCDLFIRDMHGYLGGTLATEYQWNSRNWQCYNRPVPKLSKYNAVRFYVVCWMHPENITNA